MNKALLACIFAVVPLLANAQGRERREHEHFRSPHWVFDDRFHHNHYYPAIGYSVGVLPEGYVTVGFRGGRFFFHAGVWFQAAGPGFVVVRPPVGVVVPVLPPAYTTVWIAGLPYYYANDIYYVQTPGGYTVAAPPNVAAAPAPAPQAPPSAAAPPPAPQAAAPAQAGTWFYCESAKAYYPYVAECKEGWRQVPATPPAR